MSKNVHQVEYSDIDQGWSLIHLKENFSEVQEANLLSYYPERVSEMKALYEEWQKKFNRRNQK